jgi:hypothetical protein
MNDARAALLRRPMATAGRKPEASLPSGLERTVATTEALGVGPGGVSDAGVIARWDPKEALEVSSGVLGAGVADLGGGFAGAGAVVDEGPRARVTGLARAPLPAEGMSRVRVGASRVHARPSQIQMSLSARPSASLPEYNRGRRNRRQPPLEPEAPRGPPRTPRPTRSSGSSACAATTSPWVGAGHAKRARAHSP